MKKKLTFNLSETFQLSKTPKLAFAKLIDDPNAMVHLVDKDPNSEFYFKIIKTDSTQGELKYVVEFKPVSSTDLNKYYNTLVEKTVISYLNLWLGLLETYNNLHTIFDDPILIANQKKFEDKFKLTDEDADLVGFEFEQQLFLYEYLEKAKASVLRLKEDRAPEETAELEELIEIADSLQANIGKETKSQIMKRLTKFWAKAQKVGIEVMKEIFVNVVTELTTKLLRG